MNDKILTPAQKRGLAWVYETRGEWRNKAGRLHAALSSLAAYHKELVECRMGHFGKRGGYEVQWRITPTGAERFESIQPKESSDV